MIYLLYGNDSQKAEGKFHSLVDALLAKKPDASIHKLQEDSFEIEQLDELVYGQGLFEKKYIVSCNRLCANKEHESALLKSLKDIAASQNIFVFLEGELPAKSKNAFEKVAEKVQLFEKKETKQEAFNRFALTDALGARDRKKLWLLYTEAMEAGIAGEEIHGLLFWQVKSMLLARGVERPEDADMKAYPFKKAKGYAHNYSENELCRLSKDLVDVYHSARRGEYDLSLGLEKLALSI